jgi:hypothetical protein
MTSIGRHVTDAEIKAVSKMSKTQLAQMHVDNGGLMGFAHYKTWSHDELVNAVIIDLAVDGNE